VLSKSGDLQLHQCNFCGKLGLGTASKLCQTVFTMVERSFVILRYAGKVPMMASCTQCQRKFFTPNIYHGDPIGAEQYLTEKFAAHNCEPKNDRWKGQTRDR
jgi:hypothetical protein